MVSENQIMCHRFVTAKKGGLNVSFHFFAQQEVAFLGVVVLGGEIVLISSCCCNWLSTAEESMYHPLAWASLPKPWRYLCQTFWPWGRGEGASFFASWVSPQYFRKILFPLHHWQGEHISFCDISLRWQFSWSSGLYFQTIRNSPEILALLHVIYRPTF